MLLQIESVQCHQRTKVNRYTPFPYPRPSVIDVYAWKMFWNILLMVNIKILPFQIQGDLWCTCKCTHDIPESTIEVKQLRKNNSRLTIELREKKMALDTVIRRKYEYCIIPSTLLLPLLIKVSRLLKCYSLVSLDYLVNWINYSNKCLCWKWFSSFSPYIEIFHFRWLSIYQNGVISCLLS